MIRRAPLQILSGAKGPASAGDHKATNFFVAFTIAQCFEYFLIHLRHESVQRLGPIERDGRYAVVLVIEDRFVGHSDLLTCEFRFALFEKRFHAFGAVCRGKQ